MAESFVPKFSFYNAQTAQEKPTGRKRHMFQEMSPKAGLIISRFDGLTGGPGKGQKEGQEDDQAWAPCQSIKPAYDEACLRALKSHWVPLP